MYIGGAVSSSCLMDYATPINNGLQHVSLFSALKLSISFLLKGNNVNDVNNTLKPSPLAVVYGAPISLPYTSNPNPQVGFMIVGPFFNVYFKRSILLLYYLFIRFYISGVECFNMLIAFKKNNIYVDLIFLCMFLPQLV